MKKLSCILITVILILSMGVCPVKAEGTPAPDEFKNALATFLGKDVADLTEYEIYNWSSCISTLSTTFQSQKGIAGLLGNIKCEGGASSIYCVEGYGKIDFAVLGGFDKCSIEYTKSNASDVSTAFLGNKCNIDYKSAEYAGEVDKSVFLDVSKTSFESKIVPFMQKGGIIIDMGVDLPATNVSSVHMGACGHGVIQWSFGRASELTQFCIANKDLDGFYFVGMYHWILNKADGKVGPMTVNGVTYHNGIAGSSSDARRHTAEDSIFPIDWSNLSGSVWEKGFFCIPDMAGQMMFLINEICNKSAYSDTLTAMNSSTDEKSAASTVFHNLEGLSESKNSTLPARKEAATLALNVVATCNGIYGSLGYGSGGIPNINPGNTPEATGTPEASIEAQQQQMVAEYMYNTGAWTEDQISSYSRLAEADLTSLLERAERDRLSLEESNGVSNWKAYIDGKMPLPIKILRISLMVVGILIISWFILMYISYWFDKINPFGISLLYVTSFGRLKIAVDDEKETFDIRKKKRSEIRTVSHKTMLKICLIGVFLSSFLVSGLIYKILFWFIFKVINFLS